jgi:hypothetical protein
MRMPSVSADECHMAQRVKQATRSRAVQDGADTDALIPGSFPPPHHHSTNSIYSRDCDSNSSLLLADDEDSLAGSPDEADGELC